MKGRNNIKTTLAARKWHDLRRRKTHDVWQIWLYSGFVILVLFFFVFWNSTTRFFFLSDINLLRIYYAQQKESFMFRPTSNLFFNIPHITLFFDVLKMGLVTSFNWNWALDFLFFFENRFLNNQIFLDNSDGYRKKCLVKRETTL